MALFYLENKKIVVGPTSKILVTLRAINASQ